MKIWKLTLICLAILATMSIGVALVLSPLKEEVGANIAWDPKGYTFDNPIEQWNAEIWLKGGHKAQIEIDPATIKLEGLYSLSGAPYNATHGPRLILPFTGSDVRAALLPKLPTHMGVLIPGTYRIALEITGNLKPEYGGTPIRGSGVVVVTVPPPSQP